MEREFNCFGTMLDCSRNAVMNVKSVKKWIDLTASMGYNTLMLYTEDTYEVDSEPYFGYLRGRYSKEELREIDDYAFSKNMTVIPCIQTLAHLNAAIRWPKYNNICDCNDILLVGDDGTYELIDNMFKSLSQSFRSKTVHIGMDEAHMIGRGKYLDINGCENRTEILLKHLNKVSEIAKKYGYELLMWGDMFFRLATGGEYSTNVGISDEVKKKVPDNVNLVYWDYYSIDENNYLDKIKSHSEVKENIWFAGGLWTWTGFAPNNEFTFEATKAALSACRKTGVKNVILTIWGDDGAECSRFSVLPSLYYASQLAVGNYDMQKIKDGFQKKFGVDFDGFMLLDLAETYEHKAGDVYNPEKYLLYNDCLLGLFDGKLKDEMITGYAEISEKLAKFENNPKYGRLFKTLKYLCKVLSFKCEIGLKLRKAYKNNETEELKRLLSLFDTLLANFELFYSAFESQWMEENKPHGFDVQDIRLGGLKQRIQHTKLRIEQYLSGEISEIAELEESILDINGKGETSDKKPMLLNSWSLTSTVNVIS